MSYKTEYVHLVSQISERLITSGYHVWFAEYEVLLQNYNRFQKAIEKGIQRSCYGVCFTNDRYVGSQHCRRGIEQLLDPHNCSLDNIIEIMVPNEPRNRIRYPGIVLCPFLRKQVH